jgi:hypothetical protein
MYIYTVFMSHLNMVCRRSCVKVGEREGECPAPSMRHRLRTEPAMHGPKEETCWFIHRGKGVWDSRRRGLIRDKKARIDLGLQHSNIQTFNHSIIGSGQTRPYRDQMRRPVDSFVETEKDEDSGETRRELRQERRRGFKYPNIQIFKPTLVSLSLSPQLPSASPITAPLGRLVSQS